jgi:hypothetical protein
MSSLLRRVIWCDLMPPLPAPLPPGAVLPMLGPLAFHNAPADNSGLAPAWNAPPQHLHPDAVGRLLDPHAIMDPPVIVRVLRDNWSTHIPLTYLTYDRCGEFAATDQTDTRGPADSSKIRLSSKDEEKITVDEFNQAWPHFCSMIEKYLPSPQAADIAGHFRSHFLAITQRVDFYAKFSSYMAYDLHVRKSWESHPGSFSPAVFQDPLWSFIQEKARDAKLDAAIAPGTRPSVGGALQSALSGAVGRGSVSRGPFRGRPSRGGQQYPGGSLFCYVCGSKDHSGRDCNQTSNGFISKGSSGWLTASGSKVCFRWNGTYGSCSNASCPYPHVCSRCGSSDHNAPSHPPA